MASFRVEIEAAAERDFRAVPFPFRRKINIQLNKLKDDPAPSESEMVDEGLMRLHVHGWHVLYDVDEDAGIVTILAITETRSARRR
jgi:mRNA-degrading endonuclease RelE of RelBE toxin-antitoxin system